MSESNTNLRSNAFIVPVVYFWFPETTNRSLEEMDFLFRKSNNMFEIVSLARNEPHMYGPNGELLRTLEDVEDEAVRRASVLSNPAKTAERSHHEHMTEIKDSDGGSSEEK